MEALRPGVFRDDLLAAAIKKDLANKYNKKFQKMKELEAHLVKEQEKLKRIDASQKRIKAFNSKVEEYKRGYADLKRMFKTVRQIDKNYDLDQFYQKHSEGGAE